MNAKRTEYDGRTYDSRGEAKYAEHLDYLYASGEVIWWSPQCKILIGDKVSTYIVDFLVFRNYGIVEAHEFKGVETAKFKEQKKRWALWGPMDLVIIKYRAGTGLYTDEIIESRLKVPDNA